MRKRGIHRTGNSYVSRSHGSHFSESGRFTFLGLHFYAALLGSGQNHSGASTRSPRRQILYLPDCDERSKYETSQALLLHCRGLPGVANIRDVVRGRPLSQETAPVSKLGTDILWDSKVLSKRRISLYDAVILYRSNILYLYELLM